MNKFPKIPSANLEAVCQILGDATTGGCINQHLDACNIEDTSDHSTKWRRLYAIFAQLQHARSGSNYLCQFIKSLLFSQSYIERRDEFEAIRTRLNQYLLFSGIEYWEDGEFYVVTKATTLSETESRTQTLQHKLQGRSMHPEVLKYCRTELLQDNYFHAVFEASKGLAQRIREKSGVDGDGAKLVGIGH